MRVLVTGPTGLVGSGLVDALLKKKHKVWVFARSPDRCHPKAECIKGDIRKYNSVLNAVAKTKPDIVYHLAADLHEGSPHLFDINVEGTKHVVNACKTLKKKPWLVYPSSIGILSVEGGRVREDNDYDPRTAYEKSKVLAESAVFHSGLDFTIVRAPVLVGPNKFWKQIFKAAEDGYPVIGEGDNHWPLGDYRDFIRLLASLPGKPSAKNHSFNFSSGDNNTYSEIYSEICKVLRIKKPSERISVNKALLGALAYESYCYLTGKKPSVTKTRAAIKRLTRDSVVSTKKLEKVLKFKPKHSLNASLKNALRELSESVEVK